MELGYTDPEVDAVRALARRQHLEVELQAAEKLQREGELSGAIRLLKQLVEADAEWITPRQRLLEIYVRKHDFEEANTHFQWLAEHGVEHPRIALVGGAIAITRRDFVEAIDALTYVAFVDSDAPGVHAMLGTALRRTGQYRDAEAAFRTALQHNPQDAIALDGLAAIRLHGDEFEEAASFSLQALECDMQAFAPHYRLGVALAGMGRMAEATAALNTAARLAPTRGAPYRRLAKINQASYATAAHYFELARKALRQRRAARCTSQ
jgi:tetratricopeptide (TPR) repeat protein